jgi:hypothetical protein
MVVRHQGNLVRGLRASTNLLQRLFVRFAKDRDRSINQLHFRFSFLMEHLAGLEPA